MIMILSQHFSEEQSKTVNEYKFRVQKAEAEVSTLQANVSTLVVPFNESISTKYINI